MTTESPVLAGTQLECARLGVLVQRNNVGACQDKTGRLIRFGLMNESAKVNEILKSSDLICVTPIRITPEMIGQVIGVYTALETKRPGWHLTPGDDRGQAQDRYHQLVRQHGGRAGFVTCDADVRRITGLGA